MALAWANEKENNPLGGRPRTVAIACRGIGGKIIRRKGLVRNLRSVSRPSDHQKKGETVPTIRDPIQYPRKHACDDEGVSGSIEHQFKAAQKCATTINNFAYPF
jgi:hypothetical protein